MCPCVHYQFSKEMARDEAKRMALQSSVFSEVQTSSEADPIHIHNYPIHNLKLVYKAKVNYRYQSKLYYIRTSSFFGLHLPAF